MERILSCGRRHSPFVRVYAPALERAPWRNSSEYARVHRLHGKKYVIKKHTMASKLAVKYVFARKTRHYLESVRSRLSAAPVAIDIERRFYELADAWQRETVHLSSTTKRVLNPNYQAIMAM